MAGTWIQMQVPFIPDTALLLTDGTVMCHENDSPNWHLLSPLGVDYANGSWSALTLAPDIVINNTSTPYAPSAFASAVLTDGRVFVAGGEYNAGVRGSAAQRSNPMFIYDPREDRWTPVAPPSFWPGADISDSPSCVLADGRVLLGAVEDSGLNAAAIYDPVVGSWVNAGKNGPKPTSCAEETWTLLPDGSVLAIVCESPPATLRYVPEPTDAWINAGSTAQPLAVVTEPGDVAEIGPGLLLPSGSVFQIGALAATGLYPSGGPWTNGPNIPTAAGLSPSSGGDAPACLLPNGRVLFVVNSGSVGTVWEFDPISGMITPVPSPPGTITSVVGSRLLMLPSGQALLTTYQPNGMWLYNPEATPEPLPAWRPAITAYPPVMFHGNSYVISGTQFNGLSQACSYGDDAQMATNYPIVQVTNLAQRSSLYLRSYNFSTMGVATGSTAVSCTIDVPSDLPLGATSLVVIANGIPSEVVQFKVEGLASESLFCRELRLAIGNYLQQIQIAQMQSPSESKSANIAALERELAALELTYEEKCTV